MSEGLGTGIGLVAALVGHSRRKKALKRIDQQNKNNRRVHEIGGVTPDQMIPCNEEMGNIILSGGTEIARNALILQNCEQEASIGVPVIILHEGNRDLEQLLHGTFYGQRYLRLIHERSPYYDPIYHLQDVEIGHLFAEASPAEHKINSGGAIYVQALATLLRKRGVTPYTRMFTHCPHASIQQMIVQMENAGNLTADEADRLRNEVTIEAGELADVAYFFQQLELESSILPWKSHLARCTSIAECVRRGGIMAIDVTSCERQHQMALITAELARCGRAGTPLRIIVDAVSITGSESLMRTLRNASRSVAWTMSSPDISRMIGNTQGELAAWLARAHRAVLFAHGIKTCELLSAELGEYEHIDIVETRADNNSIGRIGYHYGGNAGYSTSTKRRRVLQPEELEALGVDEFVMLDNDTAAISRGTLV